MKKGCSTETLTDTYNILVRDQRNEWCREGIIGTILDMFADYEQEVQGAMKSL